MTTNTPERTQAINSSSARLILEQKNLQLSYDNQCLHINGKDFKLKSIPLKHLQQIICMHGVELTSQLLGQLSRRSIDFIVINQRYSQNSIALYGSELIKSQRRCIQYQWQQSQSQRLPIAKAICAHKLRISLRVLKNKHNTKNQIQQTTQANINGSLHSLMLFNGDEDQLRGLEGSAQRQLFAYWRSVLPPSLEFTKRQRRPPPDPVNSVLSLTFTLVYQQAIRQCKLRGLDSELGFYHRPLDGRHSLACDLMEPLRPKIEEWVIGIFQQGVLDKRHFTKTTLGCLLGKKGKEIYYAHLAEKEREWQRTLDAYSRWLMRLIDLDRRNAN